MRQDLGNKILDLTHFIFESFVRSIRPDEATIPHLLKSEEQRSSVAVLAHRKAWSHFPAEPMPATRNEGHTEASFAIDETRDVRRQIHGKDQGRRIMKGLTGSRLHPGISPLSRYRDHASMRDLTLGIAHDATCGVARVSPI